MAKYTYTFEYNDLLPSNAGRDIVAILNHTEDVPEWYIDKHADGFSKPGIKTSEDERYEWFDGICGHVADEMDSSLDASYDPKFGQLQIRAKAASVNLEFIAGVISEVLEKHDIFEVIGFSAGYEKHTSYSTEYGGASVVITPAEHIVSHTENDAVVQAAKLGKYKYRWPDLPDSFDQEKAASSIFLDAREGCIKAIIEAAAKRQGIPPENISVDGDSLPVISQSVMELLQALGAESFKEIIMDGQAKEFGYAAGLLAIDREIDPLQRQKLSAIRQILGDYSPGDMSIYIEAGNGQSTAKVVVAAWNTQADLEEDDGLNDDNSPGM